MINIEKHVSSLNLSQYLKDKKIEQESLYYWIKSLNPTSEYHLSMKRGFDSNYHANDMISAFTSDELFDLIPYRITLNRNEPFNTFRIRMEQCLICEDENEGFKKVFLINYYCDSTEATGENAWLVRKLLPHKIYDTQLSNCLARLLVELYEKNYVKIIA